ncbi:MAG: ribosome maturation factor RimM [Bacteroidetes bacterium]|jgi:16S rRNA processing protein RimM|nr:ribosome maturation factor RimM [Bacteroidota bacterium]
MLGYTLRASGVQGEVIIELDVDDPSRYKKLDSIFIELHGSLVPFFVKGTKLNGNSLTVKLDGVDKPDDTRSILKCSVFLPLDKLPKLNDKTFYNHEIVGFEVIDERFGVVGIAEEILDRMMQPVIKIKSGKQEVMIPLSEGAIIKVDRAERKLYVTSPEGLIELYLTLGNDVPDDQD